MADTLVETDVSAILDSLNGLWGPYWSDESTAIIVFLDAGTDLNYARTTDKGATWTTTQIVAGTVRKVSCWYDKETPNNSGTLIHIAWLDATGDDFAYYITLDVAADSLGTRRTVDETLTTGGGSSNRIAITQLQNGTIIYAFSTQSEIECYKSSDNFATAGTDIAAPFETAAELDFCLLFPANVDAGDVCALFWDRSANALSLKMYDDSANSWTETVISGSMIDDTSFVQMDGSVRHSDNHLLLAIHSDADSAGDDLRTWDLTVDSIASPTITAKTNVFTDQNEAGQVSVFINQQNDDVYIAYLKGGTWFADINAVFHKSTDGMGAWGAEQAYSEDVGDDLRLIQAGRTVDSAGGRYQPAFYNDDLADIYVNLTNDIEFTAIVEEPSGQPQQVSLVTNVIRIPGRMVGY